MCGPKFCSMKTSQEVRQLAAAQAHATLADAGATARPGLGKPFVPIYDAEDR